jgi:hypothetical protein
MAYYQKPSSRLDDDRGLLKSIVGKGLYQLGVTRLRRADPRLQDQRQTENERSEEPGKP